METDRCSHDEEAMDHIGEIKGHATGDAVAMLIAPASLRGDGEQGTSGCIRRTGRQTSLTDSQTSLIRIP